MADGYTFLNCGICLGDIVPDGSLLNVDPASDIEIGDIVTVVMKSDGPFASLVRRLSAEDMLGVTKIFLGTQRAFDGEPVYLFGQLVPPLVAPIPQSALDAVHLVSGGTAPDAQGEMSEHDRNALDLLSPFFCGGASPSINPSWRPPEMARFHAGLTETAIGPAPGAAADLMELILKARDAGLSEDEEVKFGDAFNAVWYNLPYVNLFYVKPALDFLFVSSLREAARPGYLKRTHQRRWKEYKQKPFGPKPLRPFG